MRCRASTRQRRDAALGPAEVASPLGDGHGNVLDDLLLAVHDEDQRAGAVRQVELPDERVVAIGGCRVAALRAVADGMGLLPLVLCTALQALGAGTVPVVPGGAGLGVELHPVAEPAW